jgi:hypothetical protein
MVQSSYAQLNGPPAPPPPPLDEFNGTPDVSFYLKNPGVNNIMELEIVAFAHGLTPGTQYCVGVIVLTDTTGAPQPGDWFRVGDKLIADAEGKALFIDKFDSFNNQLPIPNYFYYYKIYLIKDDGTPNGKWVDDYGWESFYVGG